VLKGLAAFGTMNYKMGKLKNFQIVDFSVFFPYDNRQL